MKILITTPIYPPEIGGPASYTVEVARRLSARHEVTVVAYTDEKDSPAGVRLIAVSKKDRILKRLLNFFIAVLKASKNADVIYAQNAMAAGLPAALVSMLRKKPLIIKIVGDEAWERANQTHQTEKTWEEFLKEPEGNQRIKIMMKIQGFVLRKAKLVTTPSAYMCQEIVNAYKTNPKTTLPNYNAAEETERLPFTPQKISHQIATTARLIHLKHIDGIVRALVIVKKKYSDAKLVIAGEGPEEETLKKLAKDLGLETDVIFLGKTSRAETWQLRKKSEVYVINSSHEGLPITVLTSFAAEIPVIATNVSGTNEAVYHEKTGLLVEEGNDEDLAKAIERIFEDKELALRLVQNGKQMLKEKFSWEAHLNNLEGFFKSVL